jgi:LDH2 family malate/lactate/ureidoglycolate dehydrogenase
VTNSGFLISIFINDSDNDGNVVIAINPDALVGMKRFIEETSKIAPTIRKTKKLKGVDEVFVPGERGDKIREEIVKSGEIDIEDNL